MQNGTQGHHKGVRRRGSRDLPPNLVASFHPGRKAKPLDVPVIGMKPNVDAAPPPATIPTLEEVQTLFAQHKLPDAARGLSALLGRCASDVPETFLLAFVHEVAPVLRRPVHNLRNGSRNAVKAALNASVRRLSGTLVPDDKKKLAQFLHAQGCSGTVDAYLG